MDSSSDTLYSGIHSVPEPNSGEVSHSCLSHTLFITRCYEYYSDFSQHQVHNWWCEMAGHMMLQWCDHDSKAAWYVRLEITYYKVLQPHYFLCKASNASQDVRFQSKQGPHSYVFSLHFSCGLSRRSSSNEDMSWTAVLTVAWRLHMQKRDKEHSRALDYWGGGSLL